MKLGMDVGLGFFGAPSPKGAQHPQFLAHVCCGQTAGWIKMPLDMEVGLSPGDIVLDGDPAPSPKRAQPAISAHVCFGQTAGWIKMPVGTEVDIGQGHIVLDGVPAPPLKVAQQLPSFWPMSILAK